MCIRDLRRPGLGRAATFRENLAFAHCMQAHGVPNFPDPTSSSESFHVSGHLKGKVTGPLARADDACQHLLPRGSVHFP